MGIKNKNYNRTQIHFKNVIYCNFFHAYCWIYCLLKSLTKTRYGKQQSIKSLVHKCWVYDYATIKVFFRRFRDDFNILNNFIQSDMNTNEERSYYFRKD